MIKKINSVDAKKIIDTNNEIYIVDVREEDELAEGYIENSILIPLDTIEADKNVVLETLKDKEKLILVYCRSGRRSAIAAEIFENMGYKNIVDFGGIMDWPFEKIL